MPLQHLPAAQHQSVPWKNGLGVSLTIAQAPAGAGYDTVLWQAGSTGIDIDCPFSDRKGMDRNLMVEAQCGYITGQALPLTRSPGETLLAVQSLDAWLADGPERESCVIPRQDAGAKRRVLAKIMASRSSE